MESNVPKETHVASVMTRRLATKVRIKDERDSSPPPALNSKARTDGEKDSGNRKESSLDKRSRIPCRYRKWGNPRHVVVGILSLCVKIASPRQDAYMAKDAIFDKLRQRRSPTKSQRKEVRKDHFLC